MKELNSYTLKLKLDRHKLSFKLSENEDSLELGGSGNLSNENFLKSTIPMIAGALALLIFLILIAAVGRSFIILIFLSVALFGFGASARKKTKSRKAGNIDLKVFEKGRIRFFSVYEDKELTFRQQDITDLIIRTDRDIESQGVRGRLSIVSQDEKEFTLLEIWDDKKALLKEDLEYVKSYILKICQFSFSKNPSPANRTGEESPSTNFPTQSAESTTDKKTHRDNIRKSKVRSGIHVKTSFYPLAWLMFFCTPKIEVNGETSAHDWGMTFFELAPGNHKVRVYVPYFLNRYCGDNDINVNIKEGEIRTVSFKMPIILLAKGRIEVL
ncbi:hypothetical protein [Halocola ammonii]